jgi:hypothetical protein
MFPCATARKAVYPYAASVIRTRARTQESEDTMARQTKRLTDRRIKALKKPDRYADGGNIHLVVDEIKSGLSKRWTFLYKSPVHHRQREQGLGA